MVPLRVRVGLEAVAMKRYFIFLKAPGYSFAEMKSVYSSAPADWAEYRNLFTKLNSKLSKIEIFKKKLK